VDQNIEVGSIDVNLSPDAFHLWATHFYQSKQDFSIQGFSPVPFFLLCRAIELEIKSRYLKQQRQKQVKAKFGHDLLKAYNALDPSEKILDSNGTQVLKAATDIYKRKRFEYFDPEDALLGYSRYPDLNALDSVAQKLIGGPT
jgi:hypothetical protein